MLHLLASPFTFWLCFCCLPLLAYGWKMWFWAAWEEVSERVSWRVVVVFHQAEQEVGVVLGVKVVKVAYA